MKKTFLITFLTIGAFLTLAQDKTAQKYAETITKEAAFKRLSILASDEFEGRGTGQPGAEKAAQYIKSQFQSFGLTAPVNNSYFQQLKLSEVSAAERKINLNGTALTFLKDFYVLPNSYEDTKATFKDFIFVGYGISSSNYNDLSELDLNGKVAVVLSGEPMLNGQSLITGTKASSDWTTDRSKKATAILAKKPAAIIYLNSSIKKMSGSAAYFNRTSLVLGKKDDNIQPLSIYASTELINNLLANSGKTVEQLIQAISASKKPNSFSFTSNLEVDLKLNKKEIEAKNVLGFLEGSDPILKNEIIVITAHYDHLGIDAKGEIYNGADDDGSGTTGVLGIAEAFSKAKRDGDGPKRSILFMTVVAEEKGLLGSEWYSDHPVFPLENTITNLNIDMIGRVGQHYKGKADSANYVYVIGSEKLSSTLRKISENANNMYSKMVLDYKYDDPKDPNRFYYRSDHYNFAKHNIPIIFYFNGVHEDYHKKTDTVEKINFPLLTKRTQLVFYTAWDLANRAEKPAVDNATDMQH